MLHISTQRQLLELLQRIETYKKTGRLIINHNNATKAVYTYQGHVVAIISTDEHEPLIRRLVRAKMISLDDLQGVSADVDRILRQSSQNAASYSDVNIARIIIKLG